MIITFSLSSDAIIETAYAVSALYSTLSSASVKPVILHRDHRPMLSVALGTALTGVVRSIGEPVTGYAADTSPGGMLTLDIDIPSELPSQRIPVLRAMAEQAVTDTLLSVAYAPFDQATSQRHSDAAADSLKRLNRVLSASPPATLVAEWL